MPSSMKLLTREISKEKKQLKK